jgi:hypothetical protein
MAVRRLCIGFGVDGDGLFAEFLDAPDNAAGDFASIGN